MWVVLFHLRHYMGVDLSAYTGMIDNGPVAVDIFFVLSGFVMAHVYLVQVEAGEFHYGRFLVNRLARIYPLHVAVLVAFVLAVAGARWLGIEINQSFPPDDLPANFLLVHAWGVLDRLSWNGPSWSISAEWFAYLCFPVVAILLLRAHGALLVAVALFCFIAPEMNIAGRTYDFAMIRIIPEFLAGGSLYLIGRYWSLPRPGLVAAAALGGLVGLAHFDAPNLAIAGFGAIIVFALAEMGKYGTGWLASRPLVWLGEISYAVYMVHSLVALIWFKIVGVGLVQSAALVPIVIACSAVAYRTIEVPGRAMVRGRFQHVLG